MEGRADQGRSVNESHRRHAPPRKQRLNRARGRQNVQPSRHGRPAHGSRASPALDAAAGIPALFLNPTCQAGESTRPDRRIFSALSTTSGIDEARSLFSPGADPPAGWGGTRGWLIPVTGTRLVLLFRLIVDVAANAPDRAKSDWALADCMCADLLARGKA